LCKLTDIYFFHIIFRILKLYIFRSRFYRITHFRILNPLYFLINSFKLYIFGSRFLNFTFSDLSPWYIHKVYFRLSSFFNNIFIEYWEIGDNNVSASSLSMQCKRGKWLSDIQLDGKNVETRIEEMIQSRATIWFLYEARVPPTMKWTFYRRDQTVVVFFCYF